MKTTMWEFWAVVLAIGAAVPSRCEGKCSSSFPAIFNFGDSNTDTGGFWAAFPSQGPPNGITFFGKPVGRATDGRVILDFLAEGLGLPFLSPYLKSIGSDYRHGVNFATLGSTVLLPHSSLFDTGISPFSLAIQLNQFKHFKAAVDGGGGGASTFLPPENVFGKALYTFYIGQNDFTGRLGSLGISGVQPFLPEVVSQITDSIKEIHGMGGRTFMVLNLAPIGCYPAFLVELPHNASDIDRFGCLISYNNAVVNYNNMLRDALRETRKGLNKDTKVIYVDTHSILLELFRHPTSHGLKYGTKACCGHGGGEYNFNKDVFCGNTKVVNGEKVSAGACDDPQNYVSWDGIHTTDAANKLIASAIFANNNNASSYFDPPFAFHHHCDIHPIS
ncbi:hypothetical protein DM860_004660 [Cuscuta australis]|uniref:Uncharacterized protein n=1 Tax=Cuscuta australis TaxID=267555 RepID=A0A328EC76_9ASTE|nr:hypothetical protein DM860_004660 [Cuscuta australis]